MEKKCCWSHYQGITVGLQFFWPRVTEALFSVTAQERKKQKDTCSQAKMPSHYNYLVTVIK